MIESKHILDYCNLCETEMVRCVTCNNNCCNGGSGEINGEKCLDCNDAYVAQDIYLSGKDYIVFVGKPKCQG